MKRGSSMLPEETLKIILAAIVIGFLIYLLVAIYFSVTDKEDRDKAKASLEKISEVVNRLRGDSESSSEQVLALNPSDWYLMYFSSQEKQPNSCLGEDCVCICKGVSTYGGLYPDRQLKSCDSKGTCSGLGKIKEFEDILFKKSKKGLTNILIEETEGKWISISEI